MYFTILKTFERTFSTAGNVVTKKKANFNGNTVYTYFFKQKNWNYVLQASINSIKFLLNFERSYLILKSLPVSTLN